MDRKQKKETVEWGKHELKQGRSLSKLEAKLSKEGLPRKDVLSALEEIEYYGRKDKLKAQMAKEAKRAVDKKTASDGIENAGHISEKKSSFWAYFFIFLVLAGIVLFFYFSGIVTLDDLKSIRTNLK